MFDGIKPQALADGGWTDAGQHDATIQATVRLVPERGTARDTPERVLRMEVRPTDPGAIDLAAPVSEKVHRPLAVLVVRGRVETLVMNVRQREPDLVEAEHEGPVGP